MIGDRLIVGNRNGLLAALNPLTGEVVWRMLFWGSAIESSAVAAIPVCFTSALLICGALVSSMQRMAVWFDEPTSTAGPWARPALSEKVVYVSVAGGSPYQMRHLGSLTALDRKSGKILWRWPMPEWPGSFVNGFIAAPVVADGMVVAGGLDGTLYGFAAE
jgi:outer membrane protein assembly factor BamB